MSFNLVMIRHPEGWYPSSVWEPKRDLVMRDRAERCAAELRRASENEVKVVDATAAAFAEELLDLAKRVQHQLSTDSDLDETAGASKYKGLVEDLDQLLEQITPT
jgi:hypothetical protein